MSGRLGFAALSYAVAVTCGGLAIASADAGFGVIGLCYAAMGAGWLDLEFTARERGL